MLRSPKCQPRCNVDTICVIPHALCAIIFLVYMTHSRSYPVVTTAFYLVVAPAIKTIIAAAFEGQG